MMRAALLASSFLVAFALPALAHADVIGSQEIGEYYDDQPWDFGAKVGGVVAVDGGAKQVCKKGTISWHTSIGTIGVTGEIWELYQDLGAEAGVLGWPVAKQTIDPAIMDIGSISRGALAQEFEEGALTFHFRDSAAFVVREPIFEKWKKNSKGGGPLGWPRADTVIDIVWVPIGNNLSFPMMTGAHQKFEGATVHWTQAPLIGLPAWYAEVDVHHAAKVRVRMPTKLHSENGGNCNVTVDKTFWVHGLANETYERNLFGSACGTSPHRLRPSLELHYDVQSGGKVKAHDLTGWMNISTGNGNQEWGVGYGIPSFTTPSGMEETVDVNITIDDVQDPWQDDTMFIDKLTVQVWPIDVNDVKF